MFNEEMVEEEIPYLQARPLIQIWAETHNKLIRIWLGAVELSSMRKLRDWIEIGSRFWLVRNCESFLLYFLLQIITMACEAKKYGRTTSKARLLWETLPETLISSSNSLSEPGGRQARARNLGRETTIHDNTPGSNPRVDRGTERKQESATNKKRRQDEAQVL